MTDNNPVTLRELVAGNVRRLRVAAGATPDDIVRASARFGLGWTAAWVQSVERGQKALTGEQLLILPVVLTNALAHRVGLADLLLGEAPVRLGTTDEADTLRADVLREIVIAPPFRRSFTGLVERDADADRHRITGAQAAEKMRLISRANLGNVDIRALTRAESGATDVETKIARKLGVPEIVVIAAAALVWGRSLTEEREELLATRGEDGKLPSQAAVLRRITAAVSDKITEAAEEQFAAERAARAAETPTAEIFTQPLHPGEYATAD